MPCGSLVGNWHLELLNPRTRNLSGKGCPPLAYGVLQWGTCKIVCLFFLLPFTTQPKKATLRKTKAICLACGPHVRSIYKTQIPPPPKPQDPRCRCFTGALVLNFDDTDTPQAPVLPGFLWGRLALRSLTQMFGSFPCFLYFEGGALQLGGSQPFSHARGFLGLGLGFPFGSLKVSHF